MDLKIAVISDLHCHNKSKNKDIQESYFLTDTNLPDNQNPLISFREFISEKKRKNEEIKVDILIMPGDIANKCDEEGFSHGWKITKEIATLVNAKMIIPAIGNHDVFVKKEPSLDPFQFPKSFAADFPFSSIDLNNDFWKDGFAFIEDDNFRILVINSAFNHSSEQRAVQGKITQKNLNLIEEKLKELDTNKKKYNIAICHHHPIPHERHYLGTHDIIENGTLLLELLEQYNFQIVIHGHKHDPLVRYGSGGTNSPLVFSSGSFSAFKTLLLNGAYNTFHIITLEHEEKPECINHGNIQTWFFTSSKGWDSQINNEFILPKVGFGCRTILKNLADKIHQWFLGNHINDYEWDIFIQNFQMINYLLPKDKMILGKYLSDLRINVYPKFPFDPEIISFRR